MLPLSNNRHLSDAPVSRRQSLRENILPLILFAALSLSFVSSRITLASNAVNDPGANNALEVEQGDVLTLTEGLTVEREIKGGEVHLFSVSLKANQYALLTVRRHGIDLLVIVYAPDQSALKFENPAGAQSPVLASIMADKPGTYRVEIRPLKKWLAAGRYEIGLEPARIPTLADNRRLEAERLMAEGRRLQLLETRDSSQAALANYEKALALWEELNDRFEQANALHSIGKTYQALGDLAKSDRALKGEEKTERIGASLAKAEEYYNRAIESRAEADKQGRAYALYDLAEAYYSLKGFKDSLPFYEKALQAFKENSNRRGEALVLSQIGLIHMRLKQWTKAREILQSALEIDRSEGDTYEEGRVLNSFGGIYDAEGRPDEGIKFYEQARDRFQQIGDYARAGNVYINIGLHYDGWSEWREAFENYNKALELLADSSAASEGEAAYISNKRAYAFYNIGTLYISLNDYEEGLNYLQKALELRAPAEQGTTLMWFGYAYALRGEPQKALDYCDKAIKIQEPAKDPARAQTYTVMGMAYNALGRREEAIEYFNQALKIQQDNATLDLQGQAITLDKRGMTYAALGEAARARKDLEDALGLWRTFKDRDGEALALFHLASLERDTNNLDAALSRAQDAINLIEPLRANVMGQRLRASYFASKVDCYELYIDLNMQSRGASDAVARTTAAFEASERARARALLDILSDANVRGGGLSDPELEALVEKLRLLKRSILIKSSQQSQSLIKRSKAERDAGKETAALERGLADLIAEQGRIEAQLKAKYPRYAALTSSQPLSVREIQQLLDDDTLLLEFTLGEKRSYVWTLTPKQITGYELPRRAEIEAKARRLRELLRAGQPLVNETAVERRTRRDRSEAAYWQEAVSFSRTLLGPVAPQLGGKRLIIVADGELLYLPFSALPVPAVAPGNGAQASAQTVPVPLIREHEIISLPSATVVSFLRQVSRRPMSPSAVAVFADPVFEKDDTRLQLASRNGDSGMLAQRADLQRVLRDMDDAGVGVEFSRLPATEQEAQDILSIVSGSPSMRAIGFDANRTNATDVGLGKYRIVHFATHGILDEKRPELSGLVLSLYDKQGRFHEDGFLRLSDIYELNLPIDLVVLSACRSGLGKQVRGEGLIGLTRGFMYAGAARVVASLWKVDDTATAELMKRFYQGMLKDKMTPPAALRAAQVSMSETTRWRNPYFWSGFIIQGEWR